jgi:hypothetical protein
VWPFLAGGTCGEFAVTSSFLPNPSIIQSRPAKSVIRFRTRHAMRVKTARVPVGSAVQLPDRLVSLGNHHRIAAAKGYFLPLLVVAIPCESRGEDS